MLYPPCHPASGPGCHLFRPSTSMLTSHFKETDSLAVLEQKGAQWWGDLKSQVGKSVCKLLCYLPVPKWRFLLRGLEGWVAFLGSEALDEEGRF